MNGQVQTIFNSEKEYTSNSEEFYKNYWTDSGVVKKETLARNKKIIDRFFPEGLTGKKILEIGVGGEGGLLFQLKQNNDVHGLDVSDSAINNCQRFGIPVTKANLDQDAIPFPAESLDIVFAFEVFEHFANPQHALEEIRRVLLSGGLFICSIPATCTYHWPRLFYAGLFEMESFKDFLVANEFKTFELNDWLIQNAYRCYNVPLDMKSWSWYWRAEKVGASDARGFLELGQHFWQRRNAIGIRTRPIEAIDLFRKSLKTSPDDQECKLSLAHALLYRAINGDNEEFARLTNEIMTELMSASCAWNKAEILARLLLIDVEARRLGMQLFTPDDFAKLRMQLAQDANAQPYLNTISSEEEINQRLTAMG